MTDQTSKTPAETDSGARKFTLSCSRCRASKLKCDRKEPCIECIKRNIGHLCTKDERQPRAKRTRTGPNKQNGTKPNTPNTPSKEAEVEETAQVLEYFVDGTSGANSDPSSAIQSLSVGPDYVNRYWVNNDPKRQGERLALIREVVEAMPELDIMSALYQVFTIRCSGCLCNIFHTPTFLQQTEQFRSCLSLATPEARVMTISTTISMDTLGFYVLALVLGLTFHPVPSLQGWTPTATTLRIEDLRTTDLHTKTWRALALRCLYGGASFFCGSIAGLQSALTLLLDGQEGSLALDSVLVTAISGAQKLGLHRLGEAILEPSAAVTASLNEGPSVGMAPHIRTEIGVRIWWALVLRDWSRGQALGYYTIRPSQFNTRLPMHVNDDDLTVPVWRVDVNGRIPERPRSEFTYISYTVHTLELASIVRESVDLKGLHGSSQRPGASKELAHSRNYLHKKYEKFVAGLPPYFRLGSTMGITSTTLPTAAIPVHRWMLHQQMWSLLLRLHRATVSSPVGRSSCQLLAQNIISTQVQIKARCTVCGSLSTGEIQLFNAAVALLVDLLFSCKREGEDLSSAQLGRIMTRDKIREAIELLRAEDMDLTHMSSAPDPAWDIGKGAARRSVLVLEALLQLEEEEYAEHDQSNSTDASGTQLSGQGSTINSLKSKVINILQSLFNPRSVHVPMEQGQPKLDPYSAFDLTVPYSNIPDEYPVDVLPILNNDVNTNIWQFLDFPPPPSNFSTANLQFPQPADLQSFGGLSFSSPSTGAHSSTLGTPNFTDGHSTTDGSRFTHPSPASLESESIRGSEPATTSSSDAYVAAKFFYAMDNGNVPSFPSNM